MPTRFTSTGTIVRRFAVAMPAIVWLALFLFVPLAIIAGVSFLSRGEYGELQLPLTFESYKRLLGFGLFGFDPLYPFVILRSVLMGAATAILCLVAGLPLAFFIAGLKRWKTVALFLVIIPFWTNLLIRTYAWQILLAPDGWIAQMLAAIGLSGAGDSLYPGPVAVLIGLVCDFLPFFVLPVYASVEKIDWSVAEAAADLGANRASVFRHAILPQIRPGLIAGLILVLLPAAGQFVVPDLLGGAKTMMLGNAIQQQFGQSRDWPFGSAIAVVAIGFVLIGVWLFNRQRQGGKELL